MLRVVVAAPPYVTTEDDLVRLPPAADLVELRLDLLPGSWDASRLAAWIRTAPRPVLATVRSLGEGGAFVGEPAEAARLLEEAARQGAAWIDVERDVAPHVVHLPSGVSIVATTHGSGPLELPREVAGRAVSAWKVARWVGSAAELADLGALAATPSPVPLAAMPYGPLAPLRVLLARSAPLLYGRAGDPGSEGAPDPLGARGWAGPPSLLELLDDLRAGEVGPQARCFGLLGRPPARSPSPALHNAAFRALGQDALYVALPDLTLDAALDLPFAGYSVTHPYKTDALVRAEEADEDARRVGAANTLVRRREGGWQARNTDVTAIERSVPPGEGHTAFVYGSGGYARAAAFALARIGYEVRVGARRPSQAAAWATPAGFEVGEERLVRRPGDLVVVNATALGARGERPDALLLDDYAGLWVLDAPYRDEGLATGLVRAALPSATRLLDGRCLLRRQAQDQVAAFAGGPVEGRVLDLAMSPPAALLLLGLRGAGKSTVGRAVARRTGRPFLDLDDEIQRITGRDAGTWLRVEGEERFRDAESLALARLEGRRGLVIAAGGGVVEREANVAWIARSTLPVWLRASPEVCAARVRGDLVQRPRLAGAHSAATEAQLLAARRTPVWTRLARAIVDADQPLEHVVETVLAAWLQAGLQGPSRGVGAS